MQHNIWQLQEAKSKFSEVVERALEDGVQIVTRHGHKTVVILRFDLTAQLESAGRLLPAMDSLIAATAIQNDLALATRNVSDFQNCEIKIINPWE
jgi:prevent-host-death family protein